MNARRLVEAALAAKTLDDASNVQYMIERFVGCRHERPLNDAWGNVGLISRSGVSDFKLLECVTNSQDAVVERLALEKHGSREAIRYDDPRAAATDLLGHLTYRQAADNVAVVFRESDPPTARTKRITAVFRDSGCGMSPSEIPETIFKLADSSKDNKPYLQGAFGMGGTTAFRYAAAVVLVTRKPPSLLLPGDEDRIALAVLLWKEHEKTRSLFYLASAPWERPGDVADPVSVPASECASFEPGTHLAIISFEVEGFHRQRMGDEATFDTVLNTRLFDPVTPVRFSNEIMDRGRSEFLRGLSRRFADNPSKNRVEGSETLPVHLAGATYQLPIHFHVFPKPGETGERRKFVARGHAVAFTSNGQIHKHWSPQEFRNRTQLKKLADRIFIVVETDELPIKLRTSLFTPDRSDVVMGDHAQHLEQAVAGFLDEWAELADINSQIIREALTGGTNTRSTLAVAERIARALKMKGFTPNGAGSKAKTRRKRAPEVLFPDPTTLEGPISAEAALGKTRFLTYVLNAKDGFDCRASIIASCTHPSIGNREITVGRLKNGLLRVSVAVPDEAALGDYEVTIAVDNWMKTSGGCGPRLEWTTRLCVVEQIESRPPAGSGGGGDASAGGMVALIWQSHEAMDEWHPGTVGEITQVAGEELAAQRPDDYRDLAKLGATEVPTIFLNEQFSALKQYIAARTSAAGDEAIERSRISYATGVGVGLLLLQEEREKRLKKSPEIDEGMFGAASTALARAVLSVLPDFDKLAKEAGIDEPRS